MDVDDSDADIKMDDSSSSSDDEEEELQQLEKISSGKKTVGVVSKILGPPTVRRGSGGITPSEPWFRPMDNSLPPKDDYTLAKVPSTIPELTMIELPADVQNIEKAYEMLGGLGHIAEQARDRDYGTGLMNNVVKANAPMRFSMCQPYKFTSPIEGMRKETSKIIFKIDKKGNVQVAGIVKSTYVFDLMADFQFLAPESLSYGQNATSKSYSVGQEISSLSSFPEILYCPPPYFTKKVNPDPYDFDDNAYAPIDKKRKSAEGDAINDIKAKAKKNSTHVPSHMVSTYSKNVPTEPPRGIRPFEDAQEKSILEEVRVLFEKRPVWLRCSLEAHLSPGVQIISWTFNRVLQHVAYLWQDGAFRQCYVRLGYDPRTSAESMKYQVIDFRDPDLREQKKVKGFPIKSVPGSKRSKESRLAEVRFQAPPTQLSQIYQICDIDDTAIIEVLKSAKPNEKFDDLNGWTDDKFLLTIRQQMKVKSKLMRSFSKNTSLSITVGSASWLQTQPNPEFQQ